MLNKNALPYWETNPSYANNIYFLFRMSHLNRHLVDYEYGGIASRLHGFVPKYKNEAILSERMKQVWPTILQEKGIHNKDM